MNCSGASRLGFVKKIISAWSVHGRLEYQGLVKPGRMDSVLSCIFKKERVDPKTEGFCDCSGASTLWLCEKIRLCLVCHRATRISRFGESWPMDSAPVRVFMKKGVDSHHRFRQCLGTRKFRLQLDLRSKNQFFFFFCLLTVAFVRITILLSFLSFFFSFSFLDFLFVVFCSI